MVKLTNPQGESKILSDKEFDDLLWKFIRSNIFQKWSYNNNLIGSYKHNGKEIVNYMVVQVFLKEMGYKLVKNYQLKVDPTITK